MSGCRICGAPLVPGAPESANGCDECGGSPACTRCGHARRDHKGTFAGTRERGCTAIVLVEAAMTVADCGCTEYTDDPLAATDVATKPTTPSAAPDLFDEPLFDEPVPCRPY